MSIYCKIKPFKDDIEALAFHSKTKHIRMLTNRSVPVFETRELGKECSKQSALQFCEYVVEITDNNLAILTTRKNCISYHLNDCIQNIFYIGYGGCSFDSLVAIATLLLGKKKVIVPLYLKTLFRLSVETIASKSKYIPYWLTLYINLNAVPSDKIVNVDVAVQNYQLPQLFALASKHNLKIVDKTVIEHMWVSKTDINNIDFLVEYYSADKLTLNDLIAATLREIDDVAEGIWHLSTVDKYYNANTSTILSKEEAEEIVKIIGV